MGFKKTNDIQVVFLRGMIIGARIFDTNLGIWQIREQVGRYKMFLNIKGSEQRVILNPNAVLYHKIEHHKIHTPKEETKTSRRPFNEDYSVAFMKKIGNYDIKSSFEDIHLELILKPNLILLLLLASLPILELLFFKRLVKHLFFKYYPKNRDPIMNQSKKNIYTNSSSIFCDLVRRNSVFIFFMKNL